MTISNGAEVTKSSKNNSSQLDYPTCEYGLYPYCPACEFGYEQYLEWTEDRTEWICFIKEYLKMSEKKLSKIIIDVSTHNGTIDWEKVKPQIDGAIIRATYGKTGVDAQFKRNADECERLGIPYGVYHYSYAGNYSVAKIEGEHLLETIKGRKLSYPVYFDAEDPKLPVQNHNLRTLIECFGDTIESAGYWCGVYSSLNWWRNRLVGMERFTKWVAQWNSVCNYTGDNMGMWQYTSNGKIDGIGTDVDMNICFIDYPKLIVGDSPTPEINYKECTEKIVKILEEYGII